NLSVERQVVHVFVDKDTGQKPCPGYAPVDDPFGKLPDQYAQITVFRSGSVSEADISSDNVFCRYIIQFLGYFLSDAHHAGKVTFGMDLHFLYRKMVRKRYPAFMGGNLLFPDVFDLLP